MTKTYLLDLPERAGVAGIAAVMSLVKGILAGRTGRDSASLVRGV